MNCPNCGVEMEKGYIVGRKDSGFPWYPENEKWTRLVFSEKSVAKRNGLILGKDGQFLESTLSLKNAMLDTYICRECRKGVFSY